MHRTWLVRPSALRRPRPVGASTPATRPAALSWPPGYPAHPPYGPPTYGVAPAPPGPWTGEGWTHHPHYPPPHPPGQDHPYSSNGSRPDPPAEEHRPYPPPPARGEERPPRPAEAPPQSKVRNGRESEPPAPGPSRSPPLGMDFGKLIEQYGILLETTASLTHPSNSPRLSIPQEIMERMIQAGAFGLQTLEAASRRAAPASLRARRRATTPRRKARVMETTPRRDSPRHLAKMERVNVSGVQCHLHSEWRRGPMGPRTLCNACG
ncbi:uncharacterized protein B0H18DRAFT_643655 [Fomitopsis serialis]|uniref:uncharacterized protein n=1 Tax=Fomitopsis serialis TaxID=139415 RepID=UPI0020079D2E|nr:uncharacterized protein B0H18DRAFT_643655 [Neoantrodia serialis]KAH9933386.1 hypothetical protein B0H18DRAFT_643655 [Neoantrodia serialis]